MNNSTKIASYFFAGLVFIASFFLIKSAIQKRDFQEINETVQLRYAQLKNDVDWYVEEVKALLETKSVDELWEEEIISNSKFHVYIYENRKLVFWNNNKLPTPNQIEPFNNLSSGVYRFLNGFYLTATKEIDSKMVVVSQRLSFNYNYENNYLQSHSNPNLDFPKQITFTLEKTPYPIFNEQGEAVLYIQEEEISSLSQWQEWGLFILFLSGFFILLKGISSFINKSNKRLVFISPIIGWVFYLLLVQNIVTLFDELSIASPSLYASSEVFPNFLTLILAACLLLFSVNTISTQFKRKLTSNSLVLKLVISYSFLLILFSFIASIVASLVTNSTISLEVDELFNLDVNSSIALIVIFILCLSYYLLARLVCFQLIQSTIALNRIAVGWFLFSMLHFLVSEFYFDLSDNYAFWCFLINGCILFLSAIDVKQYRIGYLLIISGVFSAFSAYILLEKNKSNEIQKRQLYANQLISDQDPIVEFEYLKLKNSFSSITIDSSYLSKDKLIDPLLFHDIVSDCCLTEFWDRFDLQFYLFDEDQELKINYLGDKKKDVTYFSKIINDYAAPSEIAGNLYYIKDYFQGISYIALHKIVLQDQIYTLFILFRSKKIPEQLGIPRLLINKSANSLEDLEDYAIARYVSDNLVMRFGEFNYPILQNSWSEVLQKDQGFFIKDGASHYFIKQSNQLVVVSKDEPSWLKPFTNFSYLFLLNGMLVFLVLLSAKSWTIRQVVELKISFKIQLVLIILLVVSVVVFSFVAVGFVKNQYKEYTEQNLREKLVSVDLELRQKIGDRTEFLEKKDELYLNYLLDKFSTVFVTDINLFNLKGRLISSSQPLLYRKGIIGKQIDPDALRGLHYKGKQEFIHYENIGNLQYQSAYIPLINNKGKTLAYLNLQHFSKQTKLEQQINDFIMAIINSAVLLLVIAVVIALFIANKITQPLRLIHSSLKSVELGKENKPIDYNMPDEIGALVKDYNNKLAELELNALQLAKSERESAWREMAKQVAHEIKNPLTPMKLTLQHFKRSFNPNASDAVEKINRVANTLVEQIDTLSHIANEFSTFAKLPKPNEVVLDILPHLKACIELFTSDDVEFQLSSNLEEIVISADKELMIRVFNNLLKNAIQAIPEDRKGQINIQVSQEKENVSIAITDNGCGISDEEKNKIFVPNFTTKKSGSGLGLAMVKQIVEQHRGTIYFNTKLNEGTTFYLTFPLVKNQ